MQFETNQVLNLNISHIQVINIERYVSICAILYFNEIIVLDSIYMRITLLFMN